MLLTLKQNSKKYVYDFPGGSDGNASAYSVGDPASTPGSGRSPKGNGNPLQYSCPPHPKKGAQRNIWVSPVAQTVKCLSAMRETWVLPRVGKIPGEGYGNPLSYSSLENSMD